MKDGDGLFLYVPPSGVMAWQFRYKLNGKHQTLTLGKLSAMGLAEARRRAGRLARRRQMGTISRLLSAWHAPQLQPNSLQPSNQLATCGSASDLQHEPAWRLLGQRCG